MLVVGKRLFFECVGVFFAHFVAIAVKENFFLDEFFFIYYFRFVFGVAFGVGAKFARIEWNRRGEVVLLRGNELVQNGARILVFALFLFEISSAFVCEGIISAFATAGIVGIAVVRGNEPLLFKSFELIVKSGLFEDVLRIAFVLDFFHNLIAVLVAFPQTTENYSRDVTAYEVAVDRRNVHIIAPKFNIIILANYYKIVNIR